ncbi:MAG: DUF6391 domain-containing protein [Chloroflexota bacterium]|nr:DUF6391 domain-containing protein [Chloroflexota bacterium]
MAFLILIAFLMLLPITLFVLVPFGFALTSIGNLLTLPGQMLAVALDKQRRRNHALEHATVNVLEQQYRRRLPMGGFAEQDGFYIHGPAQPNAVLAAAREGLERLQRGETELAVHPRCGTVLVAGQFISAITFVLLLFLLKVSFPSVLLAMLLAILAARSLAQPVGLFLQRTLTISTDVHGMHVDRLDAELPQQPLALMLSGGQPTHFRVWTQTIQVEAPAGPKRYKAY